MMDLIRASDTKLHDFRNYNITNKYKYFPTLKNNIKELNVHEKPEEGKVFDEFISVIGSSIKKFLTRFSHFKELSETLKFITYPDGISFNKLNLFQFDRLELKCLK